MVGERAITCGWKLRKSWQDKLDFSHKPQSNPSPALTLVRSQISLCGYELINNSQGWCTQSISLIDMQRLAAANSVWYSLAYSDFIC